MDSEETFLFVLVAGGVYVQRFLEQYTKLHSSGYFSPEGVPYHSIETLVVEAPDGTIARPAAPLAVMISHSTVGLPRESRTSRAGVGGTVARASRARLASSLIASLRPPPHHRCILATTFLKCN